MMYDDTELAEAALLLAHVADEAHVTEQRLPATLQQKVLARGLEVAQRNRFTTTKAGAIALEVSEVRPHPAAARARTWAGWLAAAACVAIAVYGWRSRTLDREAEARAAAARATPAGSTIMTLSSPTGAAVAEVTLAADDTGQLTITELASRGAHYQLWLSATDRGHALPAGTFACEADCRGATFRFRSAGEPVHTAWLTRRTGDASAATTGPLTSILESDVVAAAQGDRR